MILELQSIYKDYLQGKDAVSVLKDISLCVDEEEYLMGFLRQRDEDGAQYAMAAHIRHTINLLDQAGLGSV